MKIEYCELVVEGYTLRGFHSYPDGKSHDLCVMFHGFTGHKNEHNFLFKQLSTKFCSMGIETLRYDYVGSGDSDGEFCEQNFNTVLRDARAMLKEAYKLNGNKPVIVLGYSMGGAAAGRMSAEMSEYIKKLVLISPAGSMYECAAGPFKASDIVDDKYADIGGYYICKDFMLSLQDRDLYDGCENFKNPVIIVQGSEDVAVRPSTSKKYTNYYSDYRYCLVMGANHGYSKVPYRKELMSLVTDFLK